MNGEDANNPRRGIVGGMPDGFSASNDDGSKLLALLQGGQEPGRQAPGLAPQQPAFMGTMMPVPPPPGSQPQSQGHLLPPGMTLGLNARSTQPPGLPDPRASSGFLSGLQPQQQQRGVAASSDGWNPTQFVQDVGSSLLFGGNSTWSMSDQESSQGLGSLWSRPAQGGGGGGGRPLEPSSMAPPPPPPRLGSAGPIGPGGLPPTLLSRPSAAEGFQVRHGHAAAGGGPPGHHHLQQARAGVGAPRPPPQMDGERRQQPHQRLEDRRERGRGRGQEGYNRIRGSMGYTKQPKWQPQALNRELMRMYQSLLPTKQEVQMKNKCFKKIQRILNKKFRGSALHMFGSSANNLGVCQNHDIDLSIEIDVRPDASDDSGSDSENEDLRDQISGRNNNSNGGGGGGGDPRPTQQQVVKQMAGLLRRSRMSKVFAIPKARVPIVKFIEPETSIECDICVNNLLAVENTSLLRLYSEIDPRLKELVILIKHWSKCRGVNGAFKGTLSSYAYVIMVIHLLQTVQPAILPCLQDDSLYRPTVDKVVDGWECRYSDEASKFEGFGSLNKMTTAELLYQFFYYWGYRHNYKSSVVSMRVGDWLSKEEKGWTTRKQGDNHLICIEDPFQVSNDLGRVVGRKTIFYLRDEFKRAADILANAVDPVRAGLFAVLSEDEKERKMKEYIDEVEESRRRRRKSTDSKDRRGDNNNNNRNSKNSNRERN
ncbi:UTP:RNA uridylyltransferase [Chloropicon roscoffensis]|uniref:UTP:RNA uridylyltransferase n=1 Tax=Chloropicon roscoffensis TaxID=1461544 RepID=A0AAX4PFV5_9CHLO